MNDIKITIHPLLSKNILATLIIWLGIGLFGSVLQAEDAENEQGAEEGVAAERNIPEALFFTWEDDPTSTMRIDWHVAGDATPPELFVRAKGEEKWEQPESEPRKFPYSDRIVRRVHLSGLEPGTEYEVKFGEEGSVLFFRTMLAELTDPLRIAVGGDTMHAGAHFAAANRAALTHDPEFLVWGGDLAYEDGLREKLGRVIEWFKIYTETCITPEGRVVPAVLAIGNHEVRGGYVSTVLATYLRDESDDPEFHHTDEFRNQLAPYYYALMGFHPGYGTLDFGNYLSLVILDSDHTNRIEGRQAEWLKSALAERSEMKWIIPVYHVPAYPSVRGMGGRSARIREHWVPLFEEGGVRLAFENHDHAYKRTPPILDGEVDPKGIVFLGDGAWGVGVRETHPVEETWYLEVAESERHFLILTLDAQEAVVEAITPEGKVLDEVAITLTAE